MDREVELVFGGRCGVGAARMIITPNCGSSNRVERH